MRKPGCPAGEARPRRTSARCARRSSTAAAEILRRFQPRLQELSEELEAELELADLRKANLNATHLEGANLGGAELEQADLFVAYLENADLEYAKGITEEQLAQQAILTGATMPNGQKYEDWLKSKGSGEDG
jgi:hypothetical protein